MSDRYMLQKLLGKGGFSEVYQVTYAFKACFPPRFFSLGIFFACLHNLIAIIVKLRSDYDKDHFGRQRDV